MARRVTAAVLAIVAALAPPAAAQFRGETIISGLVGPIAIITDPTDSSLQLIAEQRGLIRVARDQTLLDEPFLDLRNELRSGGEQGLLGIALAPDYAESRRLFVNFTNRQGDTVIARFRAREDDPTRADPDSRFDLLWPDGRRVIDQPFDNHNGGHLVFGPDGFLYIGLGDGGSGGDPMHHAQNPRSLLGKMLRIDVSVGDDDDRGYRVPEDNPFVDGDPIEALAEIWAFGLRNPWRYWFDDWTRGGTSALLIADVGQNAREEINFEPAGRGGRNYGWRLREGRQAYDARMPAAFLPLTEPIHDYPRTIGQSVTGGLVYRGAALDPSFNGRYFYADYVTGRVFSLGLHLSPATGEATAGDVREHTALLGANTLGNVSSFAQDSNGEMLLLNYRSGTVVRVVPDFDAVPMAPTLSASFADGRVTLVWAAPGGARASGYTVERLREGVVVDRQEIERPEGVFELGADECLRVRGVSATGAQGPASEAVCGR